MQKTTKTQPKTKQEVPSIIKAPIAHNYEILAVVNANLTKPDFVKNQIIDLLTKEAITKEQNLGQKEFAQPIKKIKSGFYFLFNAKLMGSKIDDLKQKLYRVKDLLRFLIINLDEEKRFRFKNKPQMKKDETIQLKKSEKKEKITVKKPKTSKG